MVAQLPQGLRRDLGDHQDIADGGEVVEGETGSEQDEAVLHQGTELPREAHITLAQQDLLQQPGEVQHQPGEEDALEEEEEKLPPLCMAGGVGEAPETLLQKMRNLDTSLSLTSRCLCSSSADVIPTAMTAEQATPSAREGEGLVSRPEISPPPRAQGEEKAAAVTSQGMSPNGCWGALPAPRCLRSPFPVGERALPSSHHPTGCITTAQ